MDNAIQISALVSRTTKELLERHVRATGVKKGHLVEQALRHHLEALQELPADVIVRPKLVVTTQVRRGDPGADGDRQADGRAPRPDARWR
jgi:hypothetical protein